MNYAYDIECLKNLFTATFVNVENEAEKFVFYIGLGREQYSDLLLFLHEDMTLIGYNNHSYDDPMLRFLMAYKGSQITTDLHNLSAKLVDDNFRSDKQILGLRYPRDIQYSWNSVDLMKILAFDKLGISLKQTAINLKWHKIQDMPLDHTAKATPEDLSMILDYNLNDVLITKKLYETITPIRDLRTQLSALYGINLSSASDSKMANLILENIYAKEMKMNMKTVKDMRTQREKVLLGDCIAKFVHFKSGDLKELYDTISTTVVHDYTNYRYSLTIQYAGCKFALGIGGLHTVDAPGTFVSDDKYLIQDMDVASYYPNLIINNNFYPEHLGIGFVTVLKKITAERLSAKKLGDKVKADGLKITVNSIFGKLGSPEFWLFDPKQMLSTTISGQLGLLMLVEDLYSNGIQIISCNTDGVVCRIPRELETMYYEIAKNWEEVTSLELEFTPYKKYVRRDVNSYITEKEDGHTKEKGAFLKEVDLKKSYHMPIVPKALYAYFIKGIPVRQTLEECKDIMEFCISQKSGRDFGIELHTIKGIQKLQKTNRFFITRKGGSLIKRQQFTNKLTGLYVGHMVSILNDFDPTVPFEPYEVDLAFYEKEVMKTIDEIEPKQLSLFDFSEIDTSVAKNKVQMPVTNKPLVTKEEILTVSKLNKLGKNQLAKKIENIVNANQKIEEISPRYVYVESFDSKAMIANVYCLSKAVRQSLPIDKKAYKKQQIETGQLVFCTKFEKSNGIFTLIDYRVTEKIDEDKEKLI